MRIAQGITRSTSTRPHESELRAAGKDICILCRHRFEENTVSGASLTAQSCAMFAHQPGVETSSKMRGEHSQREHANPR